jgi:hypothetical protein
MRTSLSLLAVAMMVGVAAAQSPPAPGTASQTPKAAQAPAQQAPAGQAATGAVACRALEVHTDAKLGVTVVVFHHRDDSDQGRISAFLHAHDGAAIEFKTSDGASHPATVIRLKSCFGRGLLLFSSGAARLAEKDDFLLGEPRAEAH